MHRDMYSEVIGQTSGLLRASFNRLSKMSTATVKVSELIWFGSDTASATATACSITGNCGKIRQHHTLISKKTCIQVWGIRWISICNTSDA